MEMYLGLCTGRLLSMSLLLAITEVQLQRKWHTTTGGWTMQPHLATQSSRYTKHGGDVYSTCVPNALQHGDRAETGIAGGLNLV